MVFLYFLDLHAILNVLKTKIGLVFENPLAVKVLTILKNS